MSEHLDLADWRRQVSSLYATMRADRRAAQLRLVAFRAGKDRLFADHASSPVPADARRNFHGLAYWRHDPALRFTTALEPDPEAPAPEVPRSGEGQAMPFTRIGWVSFTVEGTACKLAVYWLNEYSGGLFIPFRDATSGSETYGAGRYIDLPANDDDGDDQYELDFNLAYNPTCVYSAAYDCPIPPPGNRLIMPVRAGEMMPVSGSAA